MKKESLDKVIDLIVDSDINKEDKVELMINLYYLFEDYEENIKCLNERKLKCQNLIIMKKQ